MTEIKWNRWPKDVPPNDKEVIVWSDGGFVVAKFYDESFHLSADSGHYAYLDGGFSHQRAMSPIFWAELQSPQG